MGKKAFLATVFSFIFALSIIGQTQSKDTPANISWGKDHKEPNGTLITKVIGTTPNGFYTLRQQNQASILSDGTVKITLEYYNHSMNIKKSNKIPLKYKNKKMDFEDAIFVDGRLYLLSSYFNEAKKKNHLFAQEISRRSLEPRRSMVHLGAIDARNKVRIGAFDNRFSRDSSKILIFNQLPYKKKDPERFALRVFDNQFNELWTKDIVLPYNDEKFSVEEYRIDNKGNVYLLGVIYQDKVRSRRNGQPNYQYTILAYNQNGESVEEYRVDIKNRFITDLTFRVGDDYNLVCSGFYSELGTFSIKGTCFFRLDSKTKKLFNLNFKEFDFDFVTEFMTDKQKEKIKNAEQKGKRKKSAELYQYSLDKLILRSDGGALLVAEQYFVQERNNFDNINGVGFGGIYANRFNNRFYNDPAFQNTDFYYNFNDIIVVNIRPNGEIEWATRIPKRQVTTNDGGYFSSYSMSIVRDKLYFVYNENGRNFEERKENKKNRIYSYNGRNSIIALAEVKKDGSLNTYPLFNNRDAGIITRPLICKQIGKKEMLIYGERGRNYKFASLEFM